jgi:hypothetical protein
MCWNFGEVFTQGEAYETRTRTFSYMFNRIRLLSFSIRLRLREDPTLDERILEIAGRAHAFCFAALLFGERWLGLDVDLK